MEEKEGVDRGQGSSTTSVLHFPLCTQYIHSITGNVKNVHIPHVFTLAGTYMIHVDIDFDMFISFGGRCKGISFDVFLTIPTTRAHTLCGTLSI